MSLVTRCPACTTTFKVVRDQLRISDGWVRCGRCSNVFDATLDLHETPDGVGSTAAAPGASSAAQGSGFMPGLVERPASQPAPSPGPAAPPSSAEPESLPPEEPEPAEPEQPLSSSSEDADFFDDEPEHQRQRKDWLTEDEHLLPPDALVLDQVPKTVPPPVQSPPASPLPAFSLTLPEHGIAADEPWSDLDATQPAWKPPPSTLPPFPNIDLNLASPPPASPPPAPPLPVTPRVFKTRALIERASDEGDAGGAGGAGGAADEREQLEKDHDQVQMQKALRRARAKSAKIASAKAREERAAAKAPAVVVREETESQAGEPDPVLSPIFEPPPCTLR